MHELNVPYLQQLQQAAEQLSAKIFLVGGYVRDLLLKRSSPEKDIDILVVGDGPAFAEAFKEKVGKRARLSIFKTYGTAQVKTPQAEFEFVGARKESYKPESRNPDVVPGTLEDDLSRRDFTINAMAIDISKENEGEIVDLFGGLNDLQARTLRTPLDPDATFSDDPLRMMRAVRFASQLNFRLAPETFEGIRKNAGRIRIITQERITTELNKVMLSQKPSIGFKLMEETGLLELIMPELVKLKGVQTIDNQSHKDNFYHTLQVLDNISALGAGDNLWLRWAALLHDIGKPATQKFEEGQGWTFHGHEVVGARMVPRIFKKLKLPLDERMKYVEKLVLMHLRPIPLSHEVTDSAIRRLVVEAGDDLNDLLLLCKADVTSKNPARKGRYLQKFDDLYVKIEDLIERDRLRNWSPPIDGSIIMETFNISPSRKVGIIKDAVREAILNGDIPNEFDAAYRFMLEKAAELGLKPVGKE